MAVILASAADEKKKDRQGFGNRTKKGESKMDISVKWQRNRNY